MTTDLTSWIESYAATERDEVSALQRLIAAYQPESEPLKTEFREALLAVLREQQSAR